MEEHIRRGVKKTKKTLKYHPLIKRLESLGYIVRGLVYLLLGFFGVQLAFGLRSHAPNLTEVIISVSRAPLGTFSLLLIVAGLISYGLWGISRGVFNVLEEEHDFLGYTKRMGYILSALSYLTLSFTGVLLLVGRDVSNSASDPSAVTNKVWNFPFGREMVIIFGALWLASGLIQIYISKNSKLTSGKFGQAARAVLFILIGFFIIKAGLASNPQNIYGIGQVLDLLDQTKIGAYVVGILSLGIMSFGVYSIRIGLSSNPLYSPR